jgi:hypothetical protein
MAVLGVECDLEARRQRRHMKGVVGDAIVMQNGARWGYTIEH